MLYSDGYALAFSFFPLLVPFPFFSRSAIGLRNSIRQPNKNRLSVARSCFKDKRNDRYPSPT
ncbi:MAG: hypothetical protein GFGODING_01122 [Flavobacteriales bacterium]|nr:hypothetical protein [Flavobacteriales bacterium]